MKKLGDIPDAEYHAALESLKQFYKDHPEHAAKYPVLEWVDHTAPYWLCPECPGDCYTGCKRQED